MSARLPKLFESTVLLVGFVGALAIITTIGGGAGALVGTAHAAGTTIHVDEANCPGPGSGTASDPFCSLDDAIAAAADGDTIKVADGVYPVGDPQVEITVDLTIAGKGEGKTVLVPTGDTTSSGDGRGWFLQAPGTELTLQKLTMDGSGFKIWQAIRSRGSLVVNRVAFTEIKFNESGPHYAGTAIASFGSDPGLDLDVTRSTFTEIGRVGALVFGVEANIQKNTYTGKGDGDFLDYFVDLSAGATATIEKNTVTNNRGVASSDGSTSAGILATTFFGAGTTGLVSKNDIHQNTTAIFIGFNLADTTVLTVEKNDLSENHTGITVLGDGSTIEKNDIEESAGSGIVIDGDSNVVRNNDVEESSDDGIRATGSGNTIADNEIEDSGDFDCEDTSIGAGTAGTANIWADNDGETSSPAGLCSDDDDDD